MEINDGSVTSQENAVGGSVISQEFEDSFLQNTASIPKCQFYDENTGNWSTDGCHTLNYTSTSATCACRHLTTFSFSKETISPKVQFVDTQSLRSVTVKNVLEHPTSFVFVLMLNISFIFFLIVSHDGMDTPMVAYKNLWVKLSPPLFLSSLFPPFPSRMHNKKALSISNLMSIRIRQKEMIFWRIL